MKFSSLSAGSLSLGGYAGSLISKVVDKDYLDEEKYHLFAKQFSLHSDSSGSWRGEFWGKFLRGACQCYKLTNNQKLYSIIENSVFEMISYIEEDGALSSYIKEERFTGWDMWGRKYAMAGFLSYFDISKDEEKRKIVLSSTCRVADEIMAHVGKEEGKKDILATSNIYGSLNSSSILGVYVALYLFTKEKKYLDFASYIVSSGLSSGEDLLKNAIEPNNFPYEWKSKKAYEMIATFQGIFYYGLATKEEKYIDIVIDFVKKVVNTDFTIVGGIGTDSEFFNNSSYTQTEPSKKPGLETCVTVSFMSLCEDLLKYTGDAYFASLIETMSYNALFGATNDQNQKLNLAEGRVWRLDGYDTPPHEPYFFDSYSPLVSDRRAQVVGGYQRLQDNRSFGCCAANGGFGLGLVGDFAILRGEKSYLLNFYNDFEAKDIHEGEEITFSLKANLYRSGKCQLHINGKGKQFTLYLRKPDFANCEILLNGKEVSLPLTKKSYYEINRSWGDEEIDINFPLTITPILLNNKIAFKRGPIVLALDSRLSSIKEEASSTSEGELIANNLFFNNETIKLSNGLRLCDYSSAGKNMDDIGSGLSVWMEPKK